MHVAGIDLGSATGKVVILKDNKIVSWSVVRATAIPEKTALIALEEAALKAGLSPDSSFAHITGTGYGRSGVPFINDNFSEIICHAKGARWLHPQVRTIIDVGGQDCKVISVSESGKVVDFAMNNKCAAGTGKFFEAMSRTLECSLEEFSDYALRAKNPCIISNQCSVFAESEVITLINNGMDINDISGGLIDSIVRRLLAMIYKIGAVSDIALTGGCAKNTALQRGLEAKLNKNIVALKENPQIVGALGAALLAQEYLAKQSCQ